MAKKLINDSFIKYPPRNSPPIECLDVLQQLLDHPILRKHAFDLIEKNVGVNKGSLKQARSRHHEAPPIRLKYSESTEKVIVGYLLAQSYAKTPVTYVELCEFVGRFTDTKPSRHWAKCFLERHKSLLKMGTAGIESKKRHNSVLLVDTERFIESYQKWQNHFSVQSHTLMNCDEKRCAYNADGSYRILSRAEYNANIEQPRSVSLFTILPFVLANGRLFSIFYFFADPTNENVSEKIVFLPQKERKSRTDPHRFVATTPTSYLKGQHYREACEKVAELFQLDHPGLVCTLLHDSVATHCDPTTTEQCMKKLLMFHNLIRNGTAVCQPLDVKNFGVWTKLFLEEANKTKWSLVESKKRLRLLMAIAYQIEPLAFDVRTTLAGFRDSYIWPWRPEELMNLSLIHI